MVSTTSFQTNNAQNVILVATIICSFAVFSVTCDDIDIPHQNISVSLWTNINYSNKSENKSMSYKVEPLPNSFAELGEGPHWDIETQSLYYVDIVNAKLLRYDYAENKVYGAKIENEEVVGFAIPVENAKNKFVAGVGRTLSIVDWDGVSETCKVEKVLAEVETEEKFNGNRFNDGKCDPRGRLFAGTMRYHGDHFEFRYGTFYRYTNGTLTALKGNVGISNGLAWNEKTNKFYFIDTADFAVKEYDYDFSTGEYKNEKVLIDFRETATRPKRLPDGMTIDADGYLYVATFNGSAIYKVNPTNGKIELEIKFPVEQITSAAFGGPNLDILYVTTASIFGKTAPSGTTYKVTGLGARGLPMAKASL